MYLGSRCFGQKRYCEEALAGLGILDIGRQMPAVGVSRSIGVRHPGFASRAQGLP